MKFKQILNEILTDKIFIFHKNISNNGTDHVIFGKHTLSFMLFVRTSIKRGRVATFWSFKIVGQYKIFTVYFQFFYSFQNWVQTKRGFVCHYFLPKFWTAWDSLSQSKMSKNTDIVDKFLAKFRLEHVQTSMSDPKISTIGPSILEVGAKNWNMNDFCLIFAPHNQDCQESRGDIFKR